MGSLNKDNQNVICRECIALVWSIDINHIQLMSIDVYVVDIHVRHVFNIKESSVDYLHH